MGLATGIWKNPKAVEMLKKMWFEGESSGRIALALGGPDRGVTRNAIIGKINRLGLARKEKAPTRTIFYDRPRSQEATARAERKERRRLRQIATTNTLINNKKSPQLSATELCDIVNTEVIVPLDERRGIVAATPHQCRWPFGHPASPDFHFCHLDRDGDLPFCKIHRYHAYQKPYIPGPKSRS